MPVCAVIFIDLTSSLAATH